MKEAILSLDTWHSDTVRKNKVYFEDAVEVALKKVLERNNEMWINKFKEYSCIKNDKWFLDFVKSLDINSENHALKEENKQ